MRSESNSVSPFNIFKVQSNLTGNTDIININLLQTSKSSFCIHCNSNRVIKTF